MIETDTADELQNKKRKLLSDPSNVCQRRIFQAGAQQGKVQDYWNNANAVSTYHAVQI